MIVKKFHVRFIDRNDHTYDRFCISTRQELFAELSYGLKVKQYEILDEAEYVLTWPSMPRPYQFPAIPLPGWARATVELFEEHTSIIAFLPKDGA